MFRLHWEESVIFSKKRGKTKAIWEERIWLGLKMGHSLSVLDGIDLNHHPVHKPLSAM